MSQEEAFLQAIRENPDDDAVRLVFADWLEERCDPRAEFIRVQCDLFRTAEDDRRRPDLEEREGRILAKYTKLWTKQFRELVIGTNCRFVRGLIERITLDAAQFLRHAEALLRLAPLREVWLRGAVDRHVQALSRTPYPAQLHVSAIPIDVWAHRPWALCRLLPQNPARLEPDLEQGNWLVMAWDPDQGSPPMWMAFQVADQLHFTPKMGIRPFTPGWPIQPGYSVEGPTGQFHWLLLSGGLLKEARTGNQSVTDLVGWIRRAF